MNNFSERLRLALAREGAPKGVIASDIGVHPVSLSRWLSGRVPDYPVAVKLSARLKINVQWLLEGTGPMEQSESAAALNESRIEGGVTLRAAARPPAAGTIQEDPGIYKAYSPASDLRAVTEIQVMLRELENRLDDAPADASPVTLDRLLGRLKEYFATCAKLSPEMGLELRKMLTEKRNLERKAKRK